MKVAYIFLQFGFTDSISNLMEFFHIWDNIQQTQQVMTQLHENDIIQLKSGMHVMYNNFPEVLHKDCNIFSKKTITTMVKVGHLYTNDTDASVIRKQLFNSFYNEFRKLNIWPEEDILLRFINHQVRDPGRIEFIVPETEYLVTKVIDSPTTRLIFCTILEPGTNESISVNFCQEGEGPTCHDDIIALRTLF